MASRSLFFCFFVAASSILFRKTHLKLCGHKCIARVIVRSSFKDLFLIYVILLPEENGFQLEAPFIIDREKLASSEENGKIDKEALERSLLGGKIYTLLLFNILLGHALSPLSI